MAPSNHFLTDRLTDPGFVVIIAQIGRQKCVDNGCTYFMSADSDEFYRVEELMKVKEFMVANPIYDGCACLMRCAYCLMRWYRHIALHPDIETLVSGLKLGVPLLCISQ